MDICTPCKSEIQKYLLKWNTMENYVLQERSLNKLFFTTYPYNNDIDDILIKASSLNDFYSTNIYSVFSVAKHILELKIDERLNAGDYTLVNDIALVQMEEKSRNFYSFASKYCSHHRPEKYPIYDNYVEKILLYFQTRDQFSHFKKADLKNYSAYIDVITDFQQFYELDEYHFKDIDRYLWQLGKTHFPKKY